MSQRRLIRFNFFWGIFDGRVGAFRQLLRGLSYARFSFAKQSATRLARSSLAGISVVGIFQRSATERTADFA